MNLYLGIDFGTSGTRAVIIDAAGVIQAEAKYSFELVLGSTEALTSTAIVWKQALFTLIGQIPLQIRKEIKAIAFDGTSSTVVLCDATGQPITEPLMYNDGRGVEVMEMVKAIAPPNHTVLSATSSLAKLLWLTQNSKFKIQNSYFLHQADWLAFLLHGQLGISDYHNALKLGYDVENLCYPDWLKNLQISIHLPKIVAPGTPIANVLPEIANQLGLPRDCIVCAGTTDSIAAFLASGAMSPGEAVTSLGSTLVLKLLSHTRVDDAQYGIYSHRLGDLWLVGGASNTGGAVLRHFFSDAELESLSCKIPVEKESPLEYYPLLKEGDRFPINDPHLPPNLKPRPADSVEFLHGLLESIARIEARGYQLLQQLGATQLTHVYTAGGGAKNPSWRAIRARQIGVPILSPNQTAAAYGTALLAQGYRLGDIKPCT
ncbi:MAG: FGGY-family carbohydrate kinase [Symplocastrum torsivum CPER-KK1]|jgi:sugar (pentulose or hexulose) kinase|uniref:D-ribulose kinase n=1 Tax=Symplocastrum torsivum CPER-KK1 TaxID=450513 RepID=A0A951PIV2_9CYAN|nr:FGGY-family carbohydrate kinase [Symplocastrum torsivum CPER-KK1]